MQIDITEKNLRFRSEPQGCGCVLLSCKPCKNGECFPSVRRIAEDLSIHKSTVYRAFTELENRGLLERIPRYHIQGGRRSSLYRVKGEITKAGGGADV